jgi:hypothetical protein
MSKEGDGFKEHQEEDDIVQSHLEQVDKKEKEKRKRVKENKIKKYWKLPFHQNL